MICYHKDNAFGFHNKTPPLGRAKGPYSYLMQEQPTLEMVSVGLATHATSSSKRSFSMALIMFSYLMSTGRSKKVLRTLVWRRRMRWPFLAKEEEERLRHKKIYIWEKENKNGIPPPNTLSKQTKYSKVMLSFGILFPSFDMFHSVYRYSKMKCGSLFCVLFRVQHIKLFKQDRIEYMAWKWVAGKNWF